MALSPLFLSLFVSSCPPFPSCVNPRLTFPCRFGELTSNSGLERQRADSIKTFGLAILDKYDKTARETVTLGDYIVSLPNRTDFEFLFGDIASHMLADASNPRIFSELGLFGTDDDVMVSIAPSRAGFPLHAHGRSWMGLVHGQKLWVMYHPEAMPKLPDTVYNPLVARPVAWEWFRGVLKQGVERELPEADRPLICTQKPGEVLVLPDYWYHMTVNLGEAVGFGAQDNSIAAGDKTPLYTRYKKSGRAAFELAESVERGEIDPRSVRGLVRRSVKPEKATATVLSKLLEVAASSDPLELPFVARLVRHRYSEGDQEGARTLIKQAVTRLQGLIVDGHATKARVARPLGALASQLLAALPGEVDIPVAKWLLETSLELDPTPPVQYFLARALLVENGAENAAAAEELLRRVVEAQPDNPAAAALLEELAAAGGGHDEV